MCLQAVAVIIKLKSGWASVSCHSLAQRNPCEAMKIQAQVRKGFSQTSARYRDLNCLSSVKIQIARMREGAQLMRTFFNVLIFNVASQCNA